MRRHHRSPALARKPAGQDPQRAVGALRGRTSDTLFPAEVQSFLDYLMAASRRTMLDVVLKAWVLAVVSTLCGSSIFAHIPGLRVVVPSSPLRAYGLLLAAIRDPDPVIFLEPTRLYRLFKQEVMDNGEALPLDVCFTLCEGNDVTLVSWGAMLHETQAAAHGLAQQGILAEVIDVATLKPLDMKTILDSTALPRHPGRQNIARSPSQRREWPGIDAPRPWPVCWLSGRCHPQLLGQRSQPP